MKKLTIALIVTVKNDSNGIQLLLQDIAEQTRLPNEVRLVLAGSDTKSRQVIEKWSPNLPLQVNFLSPTATRSAARNYGVGQTHSSFIVFTDAGCRLDKNWLAELVAPFENEKIQLVSGLTLADVKTPWDEAQGKFVLVDEKATEKHPLPATRNMVIRRETFDQAGGFGEELNFAEDFAFARRLRSQGVQAEFVPTARVYWRPRATYREFFLMILHLTAGDIQSGMWRKGHFSMWLRYGFLLLLSWFPPLFIAVYAFYLWFKVWRAHLSSDEAIFWYITLQPVCDLAVLIGTLLGLVWRQNPGENRTA